MQNSRWIAQNGGKLRGDPLPVERKSALTVSLVASCNNLSVTFCNYARLHPMRFTVTVYIYLYSFPIAWLWGARKQDVPCVRLAGGCSCDPLALNSFRRFPRVAKDSGEIAVKGLTIINYVLDSVVTNKEGRY